MGYSKNSLAFCRNSFTDIRLAKIVWNWLFFFLSSSPLYPLFRRQLFWLKRPPHLFLQKGSAKNWMDVVKLKRMCFFLGSQSQSISQRDCRFPFAGFWFVVVFKPRWLQLPISAKNRQETEINPWYFLTQNKFTYPVCQRSFTSY